MPIDIRCTHCGHLYHVDAAKLGKKATCKQCNQQFRIEPAAKPGSDEVTRGGSRIYRHEAKEEDGFVPGEATPYLQQIERHIEKHIGPCPFVFHEMISEHAHIDLHIVPPTNLPPRDAHPMGTSHYTVITSGLSCKPMNVPEEARDAVPALAEVMIALPSYWPGLKPDGTIDQASMEDMNNWWPFQWLKLIARLPHQYDTFLAMGHTIPNGEHADPFAENTQLGCMMLAPPLLCPEARELVIDDNTTITFYALLPLYREEMDLKLKGGFDALIEKMEKAELTELIQPDRPNTCPKKKWWNLGK